jgi:hypothetical protein
VWFGNDPDLNKPGTKKIALSFTLKNPDESEGRCTKQLTSRQWSSLIKKVGNIINGPLYWYVESWDGIKRYTKTDVMSFDTNKLPTVANNTMVLDTTSMQNLSSISQDGKTLTFAQSTPILQTLLPGDIIVSGSNASAPNGLIRKVTAVIQDGGQIIIETDPATLEEVIQRGSIELSRALTPYDLSSAVALRKGVSLTQGMARAQTLEGFYFEIEDVVLYDADGDLNTENDQIRMNGGISFDLGFNFNLEIDNFQLKNLTFTSSVVEATEIEFEAKAAILELEKKVEIARLTFSPITAWIGWVPIVIIPVLSVNVGIDGEVSVGITTKIAQEATLTAGLSYNNGTWSPISNFSNSFTFDPPFLSAGAEVMAYAGPQLNLLLYGIAGPYGEIKGYLELEADIFDDPWWELYGGLEANLGVRVEVLSKEIVDYQLPGVIGYRILLAQASGQHTQTGTISGSVKDAVTGSPLSEVTVDVYNGGLKIATGYTDAGGFYSISVTVGSGYQIQFSKAGYITANYDNVVVDPDTITYLEAVLQIDITHSGLGNIGGRIINALDGTGVSGLTINLRSGINVTTGSIIATAITQTSGNYAFTNQNAGNYTAEVMGSGYNTTFFSVVCIGGTTVNNQDATITPILSPGETRIILTWGASPSDLDSHLTGPLLDGTRFHMFYPYAGGGPWPEYVKLDLDDTTSYGPETTTIYQQIEGVYRFSVHDYSNRYSSSSIALSNSGVQVRVYRGNNFVANFNVPTNQGGTLWTVFEMSGNTITPINGMSYEYDPSNIQSFSLMRSLETDAPLLLNLPPKR